MKMQKMFNSLRRFATSRNNSEAKKRVLVLGSGWGSNALIRRLDRKYFEVVVVSPRNHFLFTPLLASTTVGTLEFRSITDPVRRYAELKNEKDFHLAKAQSIDIDSKRVIVRSELDKSIQYEIGFDILVITVGARANTFGIPGVTDNAYFLKQVWHSQAIRKKIIELLELAESPNRSPSDLRGLLNFVVVGGGPTGVEFCAELYDFIESDVKRMFPEAYKSTKVTLIEAGNILEAFDDGLRLYAEGVIKKRLKMVVLKDMVSEVKSNCVVLSSGNIVSCGMTVWSAGIGAVVRHTWVYRQLTHLFAAINNSIPNGRIMTDDYLRVKTLEEKEIFAFGDCATLESKALPATAQVADQQGVYLANYLNSSTIHFSSTTDSRNSNTPRPFQYHQMGMLAYIGNYDALSSIGNAKIKGFVSWLIWRSAYLSKQGSWRLRLQVPIDWLKTLILGRDTSRF